MPILKCKMCGGDIEVSPDKTFGTCEYCGCTMTLPKVEDDQRAAMFNRGNHFRRIGEYDKALAVYERIVAEDNADAEAHWCCALSRFGIEYVEDPSTYEWLPTCHRLSFDSFLEDVDYLAALENSDGITRRQYQKDAMKIAEVQKGILSVSQKEEPFDVFICYKESDENNNRTKDSALAQDIYYQLTDKGYKVFFSRITLEDKVGTEYEPYIFAALNSAKVMIVVGTKPEYLNAVWVKNEWSRFLQLMKKDRSRVIIPCYRDMDPYDLPEQLSVLQSYDMAKIGFIQDLLRGINKIVDKDNVKKEESRISENGLSVLNVQTQALLKRGSMALEDEDFAKANDFFEQVLNNDAETAEAYWGKVLCAFKVNHAVALAQKAFTKIKDNRQGAKVTLPFDAVALAREADLGKILDEFSDQELDELLMDLLPEKITYVDNLAYYQKASQEFTTAEGLGKLLNNPDYNRAYKYKDSKVEKEINRSIEELGNLITSTISTELAKPEVAKKKQNEQNELFKKEIADRLGKVTKEIAKLKAEQEDAKKKAEKDAEVAYQIELNQWNANYKLAMEKWEQAKADYQDSCEISTRKKTELEGKIKQLETEKDNLRGLFTGRKRKELENNIAVLKETISKIRTLEMPGEKPVQKPKPKKKIAVNEQDILISLKEVAGIIINPLYKPMQEFGSYQYDSQKKPIKWRVLEYKQNCVLLITEEAIDVKPYHERSDNTTWEKCTLRKWLNNEFYNTAFTEKEKKLILSTKVTADKNPKNNTDPGINTQDKIFLLSIYEANRYFKSDDERKTMATPYAKQKGAYTNNSGMCWWWLRSPGKDSRNAANVIGSGSVDVSGNYVSSSKYALRPALWLKKE